MNKLSLQELLDRKSVEYFEIHYSNSTFIFLQNNIKSQVEINPELNLKKRLLFYVNYCNKNKLGTSFNLINWEKSNFQYLFSRKVDFIYNEKIVQIRFYQEISSHPAEFKLIKNAAILENMSDVILITEAEPLTIPGPRILFTNKAFEKMTGYTFLEVFGKTPRFLQGEKTTEDNKNIMRQAFKHWSSITMELINYKKNKQEFLIELNITPHTDETGWYTHWVAVQRDITKIREMEKQQKEIDKLASIGLLASGVAHEVNNPLSIILGKINTLEKKIEKTELSKNEFLKELGKLKNPAMRIAKIVKVLKIYSRIERPEDYVIESFEKILSDSLNECQIRVEKHNIQMTIKNTTCHVNIKCIPDEISQVFINLINNSIDSIESNPTKSICLSIDLIKNQDFVRFSIHDSGEKLSEEVISKLAQPFFTTKTAGKGTGLGLNISKKIIEEHGGTLYYDTNSLIKEFVIELPVFRNLDK
jgi:PAS domain S-box-containing protein